MKLAFLSMPFHPPFYWRRNLLSLLLFFIYFTSSLLCDGSGPGKKKN